MGPAGPQGEPGAVEALKRGNGGVQSNLISTQLLTLSPGGVYFVTVSLIGAFTDERATFMVSVPATTDSDPLITELQRAHRQFGLVDVTSAPNGQSAVKLTFAAGSYGANWAYTAVRIH